MLAQRLEDGLAPRGHEVRIFNCQYDDPREAAHFAPQVVHALNAERCFAWLGALKSLCRAPLVISLTGTDYSTWAGTGPPPPVIAQSLSDAHALVLFHEEPAHAIGATLQEHRNKLWVIPQGVVRLPEHPDSSLVRAKYGLAVQHVVFLMAAGVRPVKNIPLGIEAFSRIERTAPESRLLLAGPALDPKEADLVAALAEKVSKFIYLGELSPLAVRQLMSASDVYLNTSLHEGMSGAILEAMVEGLPVIASDIAGNRALVEEGVTGLLFPSNDLAGLTHALSTLAEDAPLRTQLGKAGFQRATEQFPVETELDRYEALYRRVTRAPIP